MAAFQTVVSNPDPVVKWHERLGHPHLKYLDLLRENLVGMENVKYDQEMSCEVCMEAQMC